jgi:hypothetical protein
VQKAPLVGFEKRKDIGRYFEGCREELTGVTIPLKYLPCKIKNNRVGTIDGIGVKWLYL